MVSLPFVQPLGALLLPGFYHEWLAGVLGLLALVGLLGRQGSGPAVCLPRIAWGAIGLVLILLAQGLFGRVLYPEAHLLGMLYLLFAFLLMVTAATLRESFGAEKLARHIALWVAIGSVIAAVLGVLSFFGVSSPLLYKQIAGVASGNLGQRNHLAHYLWLGIFSLFYLHWRGGVRLSVVLVPGLLLLFTSALTGSRTTLLYAMLLMGLAFLRGGDAERRLAMGAGLAYALMLWFVPRMFGVQILQRLGEDAAFMIPALEQGQAALSVRPTLMATAWDMFVAAPWLGGGFGSYSWASYSTLDRAEGWQGASNHAHNLFFNLLGEMGVFAALIAALALLGWFLHLLRRNPASAETAPETFWLAGMAGVTLMHSQLEYPLWYLYFLGIFAVVLGQGDSRIYRLKIGRLPVVAILLTGVFLLGGVLQDYARLEGFVQRMKNPQLLAAGDQPVARLVEWRQGSLLAPEFDRLLASTLPPTREGLQDKIALCDTSMHYRPSHPNLFTCPLLHELAGDHQQADRLWALGQAVQPTGPYVRLLESKLSADELAPLQRLLEK